MYGVSTLTSTVGDLPKTETPWPIGIGPASGRPFSTTNVALGIDVMGYPEESVLLVPGFYSLYVV